MPLPTPTVAPDIQTEVPAGKISYIWVPTVVDVANPTAAEMSAGTDYKKWVTASQGFTPTTNTVDVPKASTRLTGNVPGMITMGTGTLTFILSKTPGGADARTVFNDGTDGSTQTSGYLYVALEGIVTSGKMYGYAATVTQARPGAALDAFKQMDVVFSLQNATGYIAIPIA